MALKSKNIQIGDKKYLITQMDALKAISMTPLVKRVENALTDPTGLVVDEEQLQKDLEKFFYDSNHIKVYKGMNKDKDIPIYKRLAGATDLPTSIENITELLQVTMTYMYEVEQDVPLDGEGDEESEGKS